MIDQNKEILKEKLLNIKFKIVKLWKLKKNTTNKVLLTKTQNIL